MVKIKFLTKALDLKFHFDAGTSRGILKNKKSYFLGITDSSNPSRWGLGEAGPLAGLSPEFQDDCSEAFEKSVNLLPTEIPTHQNQIADWISHIPTSQPSFRFAAETAILDFLNRKDGIYFNNSFSLGETKIPINGLIWMGKSDYMREQIDAKLAQGYSCLKLKIGAIDFEAEIDLLEILRKRYDPRDLTIRVDANGAFEAKEAPKVLEKLAKFGIHSIEQPIKAGQWKEMSALCAQNIIPIALDEELIQIDNPKELVQKIKPQYLIFKPSFLGGIHATNQWIQLANEQKIGWWITSALESNVGLQAISQFTGEFDVKIPQGLGTGQLYTNNLASGLTIDQGYINFNKNFKRENPFQDLSL